MERLGNFEIPSTGWKPVILPLNYSRIKLKEVERQYSWPRSLEAITLSVIYNGLLPLPLIL